MVLGSYMYVPMAGTRSTQQVLMHETLAKLHPKRCCSAVAPRASGSGGGSGGSERANEGARGGQLSAASTRQRTASRARQQRGTFSFHSNESSCQSESSSSSRNAWIWQQRKWAAGAGAAAVGRGRRRVSAGTKATQSAAAQRRSAHLLKLLEVDLLAPNILVRMGAQRQQRRCE